MKARIMGLLGAAAIIGLLAATSAQATSYGTVRAKLTGYPGEGVTFTVLSPTYRSSGAVCGVYQFTKAASPAPTGFGGLLSSTFDAVCVDVYGTIGGGATYDWTIVDLDLVPSGPGGVLAMGSVRANNLQELFAQHYSETVGNNALKAAFGASVWEIVNEPAWTGGAKPWDLDAGNMTVTHLSTTAHNTAETWMSNLTGAHANTVVYGMTAPGTQDFGIVISTPPPPPVPEPMTMASVLCGLAMVGGYVRRRLAA